MMKQYDCLNLLIENGAELNLADNDGMNAYDRIVDNDDYHLFEILYDSMMNYDFKRNVKTAG